MNGFSSIKMISEGEGSIFAMIYFGRMQSERSV
jgi:hypothetical protein